MTKKPQRNRRGVAMLVPALAATVLAIDCFPPVEITPPSPDAPPELVALSGASVLIGTGDIAVCGTPYDESTARIVDSVARSYEEAGVELAIFTTGDNWYPTGSRANMERCWRPSWGDTTKIIMSRIRPTVGNHDLASGFGETYYELFGDKAGEKGKGYYAYDLGAWRAIALNSEIVTNAAFSVESRREQEEWLKNELTRNTKKCTVAYFHRPRFSSGGHAGEYRMTGLWDIMYEHNVDLILNGHDHHYERFAPQTPAGLQDTIRGIPQIVIGTGGAGLTGVRAPVERHSVQRIVGHHGILILTLGAEEYQHAFLDTQGRIWDRAAGKCH